MKHKLLKQLTLIFFSLGLSFATVAQVTTATLSGSVINNEGKALAGATVKIMYSNAGINKTTVTQSNGSYVMPNLRVGGPYTVTVSFTGFEQKSETNIVLELGQNTSVDFKLHHLVSSCYTDHFCLQTRYRL